MTQGNDLLCRLGGQIDGCRLIAAAVLRQAVRDAFRWRDAMPFLWSEDAQFYAEVAGLEICEIRKRLQRHLTNGSKRDMMGAG